jgi:hypothetical protein
LTNKNNINYDDRFRKTRDVHEISFYVENGTQPFKLEGWKGLLYAYFWRSDIKDLQEKWFSSEQEYDQQRREYYKNNQQNQNNHNR